MQAQRYSLAHKESVSRLGWLLDALSFASDQGEHEMAFRTHCDWCGKLLYEQDHAEMRVTINRIEGVASELERMMLAEGRIPSYKIEGARRIDADDVDQYLRSCRTAENTRRR